MEGGPSGFRPGFTCPALLRYLLALLSFFAYWTITIYGLTFQRGSAKRLQHFIAGPTTPKPKTSVWALPTSLAATMGISVDFFSSAYLDVSVRQVSLLHPMDSDVDDGR